jgi:hypothetical protein
MSMAEAKVQLQLSADLITINASIFEGVVTTTTFEGSDCYLKLIDFLRQSFTNQLIQASIVVLSADATS